MEAKGKKFYDIQIKCAIGTKGWSILPMFIYSNAIWAQKRSKKIVADPVHLMKCVRDKVTNP